MIRVESVSCLSHGTVRSALDTFLDPDFRKTAIPQVTEYQLRDSQICEKTASVPMLASETKSWMDIFKLAQNDRRPEDQEVSAVLGQLASNENGYQPVYYRETITVFAKAADGKIAAYSLMYIRGEGLADVFHGPAKSKIASTQQGAFEALERKLARP